MKESAQKLNHCMNDKKRGSIDIAFDIIDASSEAVSGLKNLKDLKLLLNKIISKQSSMAIVINVCVKIISAIENQKYYEVFNLKEDILKSIEHIANKNSGLAHNKSVCTMSYSREVFLILTKSNCKVVYLSLSHPKKEGEDFASELKKNGIKVVIFEDNNYLLGATKCDTFITGADALFDDYFVNKSGTFSLCLFAKYFNKPFYVAANKYKYLNSDLKHYYRINQMPKSEITTKDLPAYNVYFEKIPLELVSLIGG